MEKLLRREQLAKVLPHAPRFRTEQLQRGLFTPTWKNWNDATVFSKEDRTVLEDRVPFMSVELVKQFESKSKDTFKAILKIASGKLIETVLMQNMRGQWTICVSSQVGCAMGCTFCATGKMGLQENLSADEIVDQYRYWKRFLNQNPDLHPRISNMVFMGMGEPLANYENVKEAINILLEFTDLGPNHITVSTVGVIPKLQEILNDEEWPNVRIAISLHSADAESRQAIVKSSYDNFLDDLRTWCKEYLRRFGNKKHHITFEYVLLNGKTDTPFHANALAKYVQSVGRIKVNLIPFNFVGGTGFDTPTHDAVKKMSSFLKDKGIQVMVRKNMGRDIEAACGQLVTMQTNS